jgi:hypothetical protein
MVFLLCPCALPKGFFVNFWLIRLRGSRGRGNAEMTSNIDYKRQDFRTTSTSVATACCSGRSSTGSPPYMGWWYDMGPNESHNYDVYLRTAISVDPEGWAQFDYVKMPQLPLGDLPGAADARAGGELRRQQGTARMAGRAGRISLDAASHHRDARATPSRRRSSSRRCSDVRTVALRPSQHLSGEMSKEGPHLWAMVYLLHPLFRP